jgi:hypothetical protein
VRRRRRASTRDIRSRARARVVSHSFLGTGDGSRNASSTGIRAFDLGFMRRADRRGRREPTYFYFRRAEARG